MVGVYIKSGPHGCRPPAFAWQDMGLPHPPANQASKPPGEIPNNHLHRCVTFAGHFARNTNRISNILHVI